MTPEDLVQLLVDRKVISAAQAQIVRSDQEVTGMTAAEVLMARGWVNEARLKQEAPWLGKELASAPNTVAESDAENKSQKSAEEIYHDNLIAYKQLMRKILGEDIYDD
jgi:hypothetical protein